MNTHPPRRRATGRTGRPPRTPFGPPRVAKGLAVNPQLPDADVRLELVARVRQEIRAGTYDTPDKFEAALDLLASRLGAE